MGWGGVKNCFVVVVVFLFLSYKLFLHYLKVVNNIHLLLGLEKKWSEECLG